MDIVKLVILFIDHCIFLCHKCAKMCGVFLFTIKSILNFLYLVFQYLEAVGSSFMKSCLIYPRTTLSIHCMKCSAVITCFTFSSIDVQLAISSYYYHYRTLLKMYPRKNYCKAWRRSDNWNGTFHYLFFSSSIYFPGKGSAWSTYK